MESLLSRAAEEGKRGRGRAGMASVWSCCVTGPLRGVGGMESGNNADIVEVL